MFSVVPTVNTVAAVFGRVTVTVGATSLKSTSLRSLREESLAPGSLAEVTRMRQKFEFLAEDLAARTGPPTDQELEAYLRQHAGKYSEEPSFSFEQIFFSPEKRGASVDTEAKAMLARLSGKGAVDIEKLGDALLLPSRFEKTSAGETARLFGEKFANELTKTQLGIWAGPIESSYGLHLVRVNARVPEVAPALANVRESVLRDLLNDQRKQELDSQYENLRARYAVVVEPTEAPRVAEAR